LNRDGVHDKAIEALVARIPTLTHTAHEAELKEALNELVEVSQKLLKDEWEKVKEESKWGDLKEPEHCLAFVFWLLHSRCLKATACWREAGKSWVIWRNPSFRRTQPIISMNSGSS